MRWIILFPYIFWSLLGDCKIGCWIWFRRFLFPYSSLETVGNFSILHSFCLYVDEKNQRIKKNKTGQRWDPDDLRVAYVRSNPKLTKNCTRFHRKIQSLRSSDRCMNIYTERQKKKTPTTLDLIFVALLLCRSNLSIPQNILDIIECLAILNLIERVISIYRKTMKNVVRVIFSVRVYQIFS